MKKNYLILLLFTTKLVFSQVGIRDFREPLPPSYVFPHPSATLDLYSEDKGLLLPRVTFDNEESLTNQIKPISNPSDGVTVFNNSTTTPKGIYIWDTDPIDHIKKYNKLFTFNETPKFINVTLVHDLKILENAEAGDAIYFTAGNEEVFGNYKGNPLSYNTIMAIDKGYFEEAKLENLNDYFMGDTYGITLPKGTYTINLNYKLRTRQGPLNDASEAISISGSNANYYDIGFFTDIECFPIIGKTTDTYNSFSQRSEAHTISKLNSINYINFVNTVTLDQEMFVVFNIGRMQGTSYNDAVDLLAGSNFKITKISY